MEYFSTQESSRIFALRLDQGDLVLESIKEFITKENIKDAVVISGIGLWTCASCIW